MEFVRKNYKIILWSIPFISLLLHWHIFNLDLVGIHVWRQTETQTTINNFYTEDFNILNPRYNQYADTNRLHRMEFPIMQWVFALFYKLFGYHIAISRILSFLIGLGSVYGMFYFADKIFNNKAIATLCAWCFNWSPVFYYYTLNPMPDNLAMCCGIWSIGLFYTYIRTGKIKYVVWSSLFLSLATLVKLPFIIYGSFMFTFIILSWIRKNKTGRELLNVILIYTLCIIPPVAWYSWVIPTWHNDTIKGIFGHRVNTQLMIDVLTGTIVSTLPELLINYASVVFFITGCYLLFKKTVYRAIYFPLFATWGIVLILYFLYEIREIVLVHDYYLFPFLPGIFLLVAYGAYYLLRGSRFTKYLAWVCLIFLPLTAFLRTNSRWDTKDPGFNAAYFKYKTELRDLTPRNAHCITGNDPSGYILLYYIDRKGWAFDNNALDESALSYYISKGAGYLFTDSRVDSVPGIKAHLDKKIFDKETLRVYKLK